MKSKTIILIFFLVNTRIFANMASPIIEGTLGSSPYTSRSVDIVKENILIIPDSNFETAQFIIEYYIYIDKSGPQIPLLFYAYNYNSNFKVWLNEMEIPVSPVPEYYQSLDGTSFNDFGYLLDREEIRQEGSISNNEAYYLSYEDLKYFETDLSKGNHTIRVEYVASTWLDKSNWITEYSLRYALAPARYWKSFGGLEITIDNSKFRKELQTSFGDPVSGNFETLAAWKFSGIPTDMIHVIYIPELTSSAKSLIKLGPVGMTYILAGILVLVHVFFVFLCRRRNPSTRFSWVVIVGSIIIPLLVLIGYMSSFSIIDSFIGQHAGGRHGYTFMVLVLYPIVTPVYWIILWIIDRRIKKKINL